MWDSRFAQFNLDYAASTNHFAGVAVSTGDIYVGGYPWRINCYPRGRSREGNVGDHVSLCLELRSARSTGGVKAVFDAFVLDRDGRPNWYTNRLPQVTFLPRRESGWPRFVTRRDLEARHVSEDGCVTFVCGIVVSGAGGDAIAVPPCSDVGSDVARLLTMTETDRATVPTDVTFSVTGEAFPAHRLVLAARSPVFRAELFGPMSSSSIEVQDMEPEIFGFMRRFIYTDALPGDDELGSSPADAMQHLFAAADRYALDRLKLMCAQKIWENVTVDNVASALALADTYNCPELKSRCMDYFAVDANLKKVIFTDGFTWLVQKFPSLAAELKERVGM
ncbi:hypothetical protein EJB05_48160, partial [Eragrostis curvula]